jgi:hypothetical protein
MPKNGRQRATKDSAASRRENGAAAEGSTEAGRLMIDLEFLRGLIDAVDSSGIDAFDTDCASITCGSGRSGIGASANVGRITGCSSYQTGSTTQQPRRSKISDGRHVLSRAGTGSTGICGSRHRRKEGADALHPGSDETHERAGKRS